MKINKSKIKQILSEEIEVFRNKKRSESILKKLKESWEKDVEVKSTGEHSDKTIEQLKKEVEALKKENDKFQKKGEKVPDENKEKMGELLFAIRAKQGWKNKIK